MQAVVVCPEKVNSMRHCLPPKFNDQNCLSALLLKASPVSKRNLQISVMFHFQSI
jgi:hypothetical protein